MEKLWHGMTNEQVLEKWDANESVWSCSMGGLGPGYEQAIHCMAFEFLRSMLQDPFDFKEHDNLLKSDEKKAREYGRQWQDRIESTRNAKRVVEQIDPSGAQFGAAMNIASVFLRHGYAQGMDMVPEERLIQVNKTFPALAG